MYFNMLRLPKLKEQQRRGIGALHGISHCASRLLAGIDRGALGLVKTARSWQLRCAQHRPKALFNVLKRFKLQSTLGEKRITYQAFTPDE